MTYSGGRTVSVMEPDDGQRSRPGRLSEGPWSIESASGSARPYARHARSMSARSLRQRLVVLSVAGAIVAVVTILAVPSAVRMFTAKTSVASLRAAMGVRDETAT